MAKSPPRRPALVTVKVEPRSSSGCERSGARALGKAGGLGGELVEGLLVGSAQDRDDEALLGLDGEAEVVALPETISSPVQRRVELGIRPEPVDDRLEEVREVGALAARLRERR